MTRDRRIKLLKYSLLYLGSAGLIALSISAGMRNMHVISQKQDIDNKLIILKSRLKQTVSTGPDRVLTALSSSNEVKNSLLYQKDIREVTIALETANEILGASLIYILDSTGTTIASTKYTNLDGTPGTLVGHNYGFRNYFTEAMNGKSVTYPAIGVTTNKRGVYCSKPVYGPHSNKPIGVVVIKTNLDQIDAMLHSISGLLMLVTPDGVVFASNQSRYLYNRVSDTGFSLPDTSVYYPSALTPLPFHLSKNRIMIDKTPYGIKKLDFEETQWRLMVLYPLDFEFPLSRENKLLSIRISGMFLILLIIILLLLNNIRLRRKSQKVLINSQIELEKTNQWLEEARAKLENQYIELVEAKQKADESIKFITAFLQNISHEVRTPLNGIIGFTEIINNDTLTPEERERYSTIVINSSRQLTQIIQDIIEIAQLESGMIKPQLHQLNPSALVDDLANTFSHVLYHSQISFTVSKQPGTGTSTDRTIMSDYHLLYKVLYKLLSNAFKYTTKGKVELGYRFSGDLIIFYVEDTGEGIPAHTIKQIFTPFRQGRVEGNLTGGMGLGLSIAQKHCDLLGGRIDLDSEPGKGTRCFVTLPIAENQ